MKQTRFSPDHIVELNRDVESFVIHGAFSRARLLNDPYQPLQFVHFSDAHAVPELWSRMSEYVNYYSDFISFAIHTGDYVAASQSEWFDMYALGTACVRPIFNCVGNHDTYRDLSFVKADKESVHNLLFRHTNNWNVTFMDTEFSMTYFKDFPESNIRLIVLNLYYDIEQQQAWLKERLQEAKELGYHVFTAMHEPSAHLVQFPNTTFQTQNYDTYVRIDGANPTGPFEEILADFIENGGHYICNLVGHQHHDRFGYTEKGVLNTVVPCATDWDGFCEGRRIKGTKTYDCFNVVSADVNLGILRLIRVGDNADNYLRIKRVLCYDYLRKEVIFNG